MSRIKPTNRREVVEQATKAFQVLGVLGDLCAELGTVDNLDRMVADAEGRLADAMEAERRHAEVLAGNQKHLAAANAELVRKAKASADATLKKAEAVLGDAEERAAKTEADAKQAGAKLVDAAQAKANEISALTEAASARLLDLQAEIPDRMREAEQIEDRIAKARAAMAALLQV